MRWINQKIITKIICLLSIFFVVLSYTAPSLTIAATTNYNTYLALGDSIGYGYGLSNRDSDSYAAKVRKTLNIGQANFKNMAVSGMTCAEFYQEIQKTEYTQAIKSADLITVSIGSNELLGLVIKVVSQVTGVPENDPNFTQKVQNKILNAGMIEKYKILSEIYNTFTSEAMKKQIETAVKSYQTNWSKSVQYIKSVNSDVTIVATEFYNPYYEIALGSYDLGGFVEENIQKLNVILKNSSNSEKEYKIAKIHDAFNTTNPRLTNVNTSLDNFNVDPHPNVLGHDVIAKKIISVLSTETTTKKNIASLTINKIQDQTYTGKEIKPQVTIKDGTKTLVENKDYTLSYGNNIQKGLAKVIIMGMGNYEGTTTKTFNIKESSQKDISTMTISNVAEQTYTGIKVTPDVEIKDGTKKLEKNVDYELYYENNINVGKATITIAGIGDYNGKKTIQFNILPKEINTVNFQDIDSQIYTGSPIEPELIITDGSAKLVKNVDYTISAQNNTQIGTATITITGKGNYKGTAQKQFEIIQTNGEQIKDISTLNITSIEDKIYTGKLITPEVTISDGETVLIKNVDYTISYTNNMNIGTATATIKGIGNYTGKVEKNFEIIKKEIKYTTIQDIEDQLYTGNAIQPEVIITSDYIKLEEGKDYTVTYSDNEKLGTATITIEGKGNYSGTTVKTFNIVEKKVEMGASEVADSTHGNKDDTVSPNIIPKAGIKLIVQILIIMSCIIMSTAGVLYFRNRDIK